MSLVTDESRDEVGAADYNICLSSTCNVVYYGETGTVFTKEDLRVRVSFKEAEGAKTVCYCYGLTEEDVVAEMRRNPRARSFTDVAAIFGLNNCRCEKHHPFGGNCACATDVGRAVKKGRTDLLVLEKDRERASMKRIHIFEQHLDCCSPSPSASLASFLERKYRNNADVKTINLATVTENVHLPPSVLLLLQKEGGASLPALVVDDIVVAHRGLPTFMDAIRLIEKKPSLEKSRQEA